MYKPCICGHTELDHLYPHGPWWKFWIVGNQLGPCYNKECREEVVILNTYTLTEKCDWFKLDNLEYLEKCYEANHK